MWFIFSLASALFQVLRNMVMKQLGHRLDDTINVWGRFTFLLPFAGIGILCTGIPVIQEGFWLNGILFAIVQVFAVVCLSKALKKGDISLEVVSQPRITVAGKAQAESKAQQP
jgi:phosphatidylglycerophosphate synthase